MFMQKKNNKKLFSFVRELLYENKCSKCFSNFNLLKHFFNLRNVEFYICTVLISCDIKYDEYVSGNWRCGSIKDMNLEASASISSDSKRGVIPNFGTSINWLVIHCQLHPL